MSTEEVTYWGSIVPKYIKDKSCDRNTSFDWNDEVIVVLNNNTKKIQIRWICLKYGFEIKAI